MHRQFMAGEPVIQFTADEMREIAEHDYLTKYGIVEYGKPV